MNRRRHAYLQLLRPANVATSASDVLAGFFYAGGGVGQAATALHLMAISACLYAGGVALNDVCDASRDKIDRPTRPIPSGMISRRRALLVATSLMIAGLTLAFWASTRTGLMAASLVVSIVLYNAVFKTSALGPAMMATCRALNLTMGMSHAFIPTAAVDQLPAGLLWLYIFSLTWFARQEVAIGSRRLLQASAVGLCLSTGGLVGLWWTVRAAHHGFVLLALPLFAIVTGYAFSAVGTQDPIDIQRGVKRFVLLIPVFDAGIAWACCGPLAALIVLTPLAPALYLARRFQVA